MRHLVQLVLCVAIFLTMVFEHASRCIDNLLRVHLIWLLHLFFLIVLFFLIRHTAFCLRRTSCVFVKESLANNKNC